MKNYELFHSVFANRVGEKLSSARIKEIMTAETPIKSGSNLPTDHRINPQGNIYCPVCAESIKAGGNALFSEDWTVCHVNGVTQVPALASRRNGESPDVAEIRAKYEGLKTKLADRYREAVTALNRYMENRDNPLDGPEYVRLVSEMFAAKDAFSWAE